MLYLVVVVLAVSFGPCLAQTNPNMWDDRTTMIHLFEWKYSDIADECERFLQYKGYGGVQV